MDVNVIKYRENPADVRRPVVVSVDLAAARYRDNGIAVLRGDGDRVTVELFEPVQLALHDPPDAILCARAIATLAADVGAALILLDGPQGWKDDDTPLVHQRICERVTFTPGKTGLPGVVLPRTWTRMAEFSIALFDALDALGWPRWRATAPNARSTIESFPTHAWRMLGVPALPAKGKRPALHAWIGTLVRYGVVMPTDVTHDQLQAIVAGLGGIRLLQQGVEAVEVAGVRPTRREGSWREGFIVSPRSPVATNRYNSIIPPGRSRP
jgi:hypothetical protein